MNDVQNMNTENLQPLVDFSREYRNNEELRARIDGGDLKPLMEALDIRVSPDMEVRVFANTADTFYLPLQPDPSRVLQDSELTSLAGGYSASTVGSIGSLPSCASSASSIASASTE